MQKNRLYSLLAVLLVAALFLGACPAPAPAAPAEGQAAAPAPAADLIPITYSYGLGSGVPTDLQMVQDAINVILNAKIGVNLTLEPTEFAAYNDKMQLRLAAGEECDIIFTAPWINSYANNVANGVLLPLDDLLIEHAPGLWASMPPTTWEAARVNGKIYGVINQQIFPKPWGVNVRKDLLDKYNFSLDNVKRYEDMEPFMQALVEDGEITPIYVNANGSPSTWRSQYWGYDGLDDGIGFIGVKANDESMTVVNLLDTVEFEESARLTQKWYEAGYYPKELPDVAEGDAAMRAGKYAMINHVEKPGNDVENQAKFGWEFVSKNLTDPLILDTSGATATLNGICKTSKNPEKAMEVLEEFNTNVEVYNLLAHGIQGVHWVWADEGNKVIKFPDGIDGSTSTYNPNADWEFGNQFNGYYRDAKQVGAWEKTKVMNDTAFPSVALGFVVDRTPIQTEIAQTTAVLKELVDPIARGWVSWDDAAADAKDKLNAAGAQVIIDEVQRQLNDWAAVNKKK
ncbi:MAG: ABC transporter substrate-binding protein [Caldilineaceae bacterium]|nr:ABC transporter substrate-binding protein [Caldilineaceae bacterium]